MRKYYSHGMVEIGLLVAIVTGASYGLLAYFDAIPSAPSMCPELRTDDLVLKPQTETLNVPFSINRSYSYDQETPEEKATALFT